jgi:hypothetical protein
VVLIRLSAEAQIFAFATATAATCRSFLHAPRTKYNNLYMANGTKKEHWFYVSWSRTIWKGYGMPGLCFFPLRLSVLLHLWLSFHWSLLWPIQQRCHSSGSVPTPLTVVTVPYKAGMVSYKEIVPQTLIARYCQHQLGLGWDCSIPWQTWNRLNFKDLLTLEVHPRTYLQRTALSSIHAKPVWS